MADSSSLSGRWSYILDVQPERELGGFANPVQQLPGPYRLLDLVLDIRYSGIVATEQYPHHSVVLCHARGWHESLGHRHIILALMGEVVASLWLAYPDCDRDTTGWQRARCVQGELI
jgi:hypothetical protein